MTKKIKKTFRIQKLGNWWYLIDTQDGVVSRWESLDLAKEEFKTLTGQEWEIVF